MASKRRQKTRPTILILAVSLILILSVGLSICAYFAHKQHVKDAAITAERAQYAQAEKDLDKTAAVVTAKFGTPDDTAKDKSCGYTSNPDEFEKGDLYCNVQVYLIYGITSQAAATDFAKQVEAYLGSTNTKYDDQSAAGNTIIPIDIGYSSFSFSRLDCTRQYTYEDVASLSNMSTYLEANLRSSHQGILLSMSCSTVKSPKAAYFPIKD